MPRPADSRRGRTLQPEELDAHYQYGQIELVLFSYLAEIIQRTNTPLAILIDTHDFVNAHDGWSATRSKCSCRMFRTVEH